jgi:ATP-dependent protease HslVU (ClpYQ) peptidase subunit
MTTIVAVPGAMYADSNVVDGTSVFKAQKIYLIRGKLVGPAGDNPMIHFFLDAFKRGVKKIRMSPEQKAAIPETDRDFTALIVDDQGIWHYDSAFTADLVQEPFMAIGSGGDAARGALLAGASPEQAVEIACQIDSGSRGPVQMLKLTGE